MIIIDGKEPIKIRNNQLEIVSDALAMVLPDGADFGPWGHVDNLTREDSTAKGNSIQAAARNMKTKQEGWMFQTQTLRISGSTLYTLWVRKVRYDPTRIQTNKANKVKLMTGVSQ